MLCDYINWAELLLDFLYSTQSSFEKKVPENLNIRFSKPLCGHYNELLNMNEDKKKSKKESISKLIGEANLKKALSEAKDYCNDTDFQHTLTLLNGQFNELITKETKGLIEDHESRRERTRISHSLLNLLEFNCNEVPPPPPPPKVIQFWFLLIIFVLSVMIFFSLHYNGYSRFNKIEFQTPTMIKIDGGNYTIGTTEEAKNRQMKENNFVGHYLFNNEMPTVNIEIKDFSIGKYEVTISEYNEFLKANNKTILKEKSNLPVSNVTWFDAIEYCNWLSKKTGDNYDLPTEAEWEIAARGKDDYCFPWGDNPGKGIHNPYFDKDTLIPVNDFPAGKNKKEIFNMAGNVLEWCKEAYKNSKTGNNDINLPVRGGSWYDKSVFKLRCSTRSFMPPDSKRIDIGFRIVRR